MYEKKEYVPLSTAAHYVGRLPMGDETDDIWLVHNCLASDESMQLIEDIRTVRAIASRTGRFKDSMAFRQAEQLLGALRAYGDELGGEVNHVLQKRLGLFVVRAAEEYEVVSEVTFVDTGLAPKETTLRAGDWYIDRALMNDEERYALYNEDL